MEENHKKKQYALITASFLIGCSIFALLHGTFFAHQLKNKEDNTMMVENDSILMAESQEQYASVEDVKKIYSIDIENMGESQTTTFSATDTEETTEKNEIVLSMKSSVDEHLLSVKKAKEQQEKERQEALQRQAEEKAKKEAEEKARKEAEEKARKEAQQKKKSSSSKNSKPAKVGSTKISSHERDLLERLVEAEAGGEPYEGKLAVATVVMNRVNSSQFPNSIHSVIHQKNQFSPVANGSIKKKASSDSKRAVKQVIDEGYRSFGPEVVYFLNPKIATSKWIIRNRTYVTTIGNHAFYK